MGTCSAKTSEATVKSLSQQLFPDRKNQRVDENCLVQLDLKNSFLKRISTIVLLSTGGSFTHSMMSSSISGLQNICIGPCPFPQGQQAEIPPR